LNAQKAQKNQPYFLPPLPWLFGSLRGDAVDAAGLEAGVGVEQLDGAFGVGRVGAQLLPGLLLLGISLQRDD
jgi:hypothetical protein